MHTDTISNASNAVQAAISDAAKTPAELVASFIEQAASGRFVHADDAAYFAPLYAVGDNSQPKWAVRVLAERAIVRRAVVTLLTSHFMSDPNVEIHVVRYGAYTRVKSRDLTEIMSALMKTDEDAIGFSTHSQREDVWMDSYLVSFRCGFGCPGFYVIDPLTDGPATACLLADAMTLRTGIRDALTAVGGWAAHAFAD